MWSRARGSRDDTVVFGYAVYQPETESADRSPTPPWPRGERHPGFAWERLGADGGPAATRQAGGRGAYRRHFRAPIRFDQEIAALVFPSRRLELRIAGADPLLRAMVEERIDQLKGAQGSDSRTTFVDCSACG